MLGSQGIILVNKPVGPSSFNIVSQIRKLSKTKKVGHAGTLDPLASGLLIILLGRYTKLANYLTGEAKTYELKIKLGEITSTDDQEGEVLKIQNPKLITQDKINLVLESFRGSQKQIPPKFSAVKIAGSRAYNLARNKTSFDIPARNIVIQELKFINYESHKIYVRVSCSKGTYMRSLARDIGQKLGVGAHAQDIKRIQSGFFCLSDAHDIKNISGDKFENFLLDYKYLAKNYEIISISSKQAQNICFGRLKIINTQIHSSFALAVCEQEIISILVKKDNYAEVARVF